MDDRVFKELKFGTPSPAPCDAELVIGVDDGLETGDLQTTVEGYMSKGVFHLTAISYFDIRFIWSLVKRQFNERRKQRCLRLWISQDV